MSNTTAATPARAPSQPATSGALRIGRVNIWTFDQQRARTFYVDLLGFEVSADTDLGFMRWLTVHPAGRTEVEFILCDPASVMPADRAEIIRELLAEGLGGGPQLLTDDCDKAVADLSARGVRFTQQPVDRGFYVDAELSDPDGNRLRLIQPILPA